MRVLKLKLDTAVSELIETKSESGKFSDAWHHAVGVREDVMARPWQGAVA